MIFLSSDHHFFHKNICRFSNRPFSNIEEMHEVFVKNWNSKVEKKDSVYYLGDFSFGNARDVRSIRSRLNGNIFLIRGDHDKSSLQTPECFAWIKDVYELKINNQFLWLSHYAHLVWKKSHYNSYNLHGHSHGKLIDDPYKLRMDVGVDCNNYTPISFEEVDKTMKTKILNISKINSV